MSRRYSLRARMSSGWRVRARGIQIRGAFEPQCFASTCRRYRDPLFARSTTGAAAGEVATDTGGGGFPLRRGRLEPPGAVGTITGMVCAGDPEWASVVAGPPPAAAPRLPVAVPGCSPARTCGRARHPWWTDPRMKPAQNLGSPPFRPLALPVVAIRWPSARRWLSAVPLRHPAASSDRRRRPASRVPDAPPGQRRPFPGCADWTSLTRAW
jgi:hypothetical protein